MSKKFKRKTSRYSRLRDREEFDLTAIVLAIDRTGWHKAELARKCKLSKATISRTIMSSRPVAPSLYAVAKIAAALGVKLETWIK